jgi:asparagine synthase (glutamine-hydrolysing)
MEKSDKASMANSLEVRLPFLNPELITLALSLPDYWKYKGGVKKRVLRAAMAGIVPDWIFRLPKMGFSVPIDSWLRNELRGFAEEVLFSERARGRGLFNQRFVRTVWAEHQSGRQVRTIHLWLLINFELWCRKYLDEI